MGGADQSLAFCDSHRDRCRRQGELLSLTLAAVLLLMLHPLPRTLPRPSFPEPAFVSRVCAEHHAATIHPLQRACLTRMMSHVSFGTGTLAATWRISQIGLRLAVSAATTQPKPPSYLARTARIAFQPVPLPILSPRWKESSSED